MGLRRKRASIGSHGTPGPKRFSDDQYPSNLAIFTPNLKPRSKKNREAGVSRRYLRHCIQIDAPEFEIHEDLSRINLLFASFSACKHPIQSVAAMAVGSQPTRSPMETLPVADRNPPERRPNENLGRKKGSRGRKYEAAEEEIKLN